MNRIATLVLMFLFFAVWACSPTQSGSTTDNTDETTEMQVEVKAPFTVTVLNDTIASPRKEMTAMIGDVDVTVNYGSPAIKGRKVWGELVPMDKVWRTGANEATTFTVSKDVQIGGQTLPAGTYGLFSIPGENDWTLIFNSVSEQWGAYEYDETKDVMRVKVVPAASDSMMETLEFTVDGNNVVMHWENMAVPFAVNG